MYCEREDGRSVCSGFSCCDGDLVFLVCFEVLLVELVCGGVSDESESVSESERMEKRLLIGNLYSMVVEVDAVDDDESVRL